MTQELPHSLRADARDNRDRLLEAARALFSLEGLTVSTREIARRAGVGPATLYRHFPTKESLVTAAFADQLRACKDIVDRAAVEPDPWRGLCQVVENICELHARDRGFTEAFLSAYPRAITVVTGRAPRDERNFPAPGEKIEPVYADIIRSRTSNAKTGGLPYDEIENGVSGAEIVAVATIKLRAKETDAGEPYIVLGVAPQADVYRSIASIRWR